MKEACRKSKLIRTNWRGVMEDQRVESDGSVGCKWLGKDVMITSTDDFQGRGVGCLVCGCVATNVVAVCGDSCSYVLAFRGRRIARHRGTSEGCFTGFRGESQYGYSGLMRTQAASYRTWLNVLLSEVELRSEHLGGYRIRVGQKGYSLSHA